MRLEISGFVPGYGLVRLPIIGKLRNPDVFFDSGSRAGFQCMACTVGTVDNDVCEHVLSGFPSLVP